MTGGGTDNLTNPPANLTAEQIATMQDAPYMLPRLGRGKLSAIERNAVQDLVYLLVAEGRAPSTVRNAILPLRAIYRRALERSEVVVNPTEGLRLPALRGRRERIARPADARALIEALETPDRALWATALYTGLRRGELRALRWEDLDLERGLIHVERSWDPVAGPVAPKSHAGRRRVPLAKTLRPYLRAHRLGQGRGGEGLCFGALPERPFDPPAAVERAQRNWRRAGLEPIALHECRHTYAAFMIAAGVNAKALSTYMATRASRSPSTATGIPCRARSARPRRCSMPTLTKDGRRAATECLSM